MIKFMNALFGSGMLLSQDSLDQMQAPITLTGESPENKAREWFGLGLVTIDIDGQVFHGFTGATTTAISDSYFLENTGDISSSVINQTALTNDAASSGSLMVQNILSLATNPLIEQQDFDPSEDSIQVSGISASQIILRDAKDGTHLVYGGSDLRLGTSLLALSGNKILFDDQSIMRIGDDKANLLSIDKDYPDAAGLGNQFWGLAGRDTLIGGAGQDVLYGNQGRDDLSGGGGDDSLWGGLGTDSLKGGLGQDSLSGGNGQDLIYGNQGDDILYGNQNLDSLYGGRGDDQLFGGQGDDVLVGGLGNDVLNGGKGADRFVISNLETGHDVITDFSLAQGDVLVLSSGSLYQAIDQGNDVQIIVGDAVIDLIGVHDFSTAVVVFA
jgi:Ca2+-binding RTX toxin-like protein